MLAWEAARNALKYVLEAVQGESITIICDLEREEIGKAFSEGALASGLWTRIIYLETPKKFRTKVPEKLTEVFTGQKSDLYINLLRGIREETPFRIRLIHLETRGKRSRLGHCPGVTTDMLTEGALALSAEEHLRMQDFARKLIHRLGQTITVDVTSPSGTDLSFSTVGRPFFTDTLLDWNNLRWMNLPTGEVIVAPVEDSLEGRLVCDLAIGGIGPIADPVELKIKNGAVKETYSAEKSVLTQLEKTLATDEWANIVGEFAFGINPKARFIEEFLESEKIVGTIHFAFGNNLNMPSGKNPSKNHIDLLISKPSVKIMGLKGEQITIMKNGKFQI
jgi:hypothetical protein